MAQQANDVRVELKKKLGPPTILDAFTKLTSDKDAVRLTAGVKLLKHLKDAEKTDNERSYAMDRLVRGVGSSRTSAKAGFYTVLASLLTDTGGGASPPITVEQLFSSVDKHLTTGGSNSKSENADICMGRILVCGALVRSGVFFKASMEEQNKAIEMLVNAGNKRSYLSLASHIFMMEILEKCEEECFQSTVWPNMKIQLSKPWKEQTLDTIHFLAAARKLYPSVVKRKFLNRILEVPDVIHQDSMKPLCDLLMNIPMLASLRHPIYAFIGKEIGTSTTSIITAWCAEMNEQLIKPTRNKHLVATTMLTFILEHLCDSMCIPDLLTDRYVDVTMSSFRMANNASKKGKDDELLAKTHKLFDVLETALKNLEGSAVKISVLNKLLFGAGTLGFEKLTKSKLVQQVTSGLDATGVRELAEIYEGVVTAATRLNADRVYAAHMLVKLLGHPSVQRETDWRVERLKFLIGHSLFKHPSVGVELAGSLKECLYRALDLKLPKLEDARNVWSSLVRHIDNEALAETPSATLRNPLPEEGVGLWKKTMLLITNLENKNRSVDSYAVPVFHTLLLQMAVQLLSDFELAQGALEELHSCFGRLKRDVQKDEPVWIEVVVDLFLSLLSRNSHLLRSIVGCVFPYLCPHLTPTALHQILHVLDPANDENLSPKKRHDSDDDASEDDDDASEDDDDASEDNDDASPDDEENPDNEDSDEHETVTDKLRMAVRNALHKSTNYQTDEESVDVDEMDEEEGEKLDAALAEAFKGVKQRARGKSGKQKEDDKTLTHFRVRVLDLIEMYLDSEPSMLNCLEMAVALLQVLEFSIRDVHQKPLENRARGCLKKLATVKKFGSMDGVTDDLLVEMLNSFLDKGSKSCLIYQDMADKISECCTFVVRCSMQLPTKNLQPRLVAVLTTCLETYFSKRDSLLPIVLFKNILQMPWEGNWALLPLLIEYPFDQQIRPFRRTQALELLRLFYTGSRLKTSDTFRNRAAPTEARLSQNATQLLTDLIADSNVVKVKEKFVCYLFGLLTAVKNTGDGVVDWPTIGQLARDYRSRVTLAKDAKGAYNKLCRALGIPNLVKMQLQPKPETNGDNESSDANEEIATEKLDKKRKKSKSLKSEKQRLKKEARLLRIQASSEGLTNELPFCDAALMNEIPEENPEMDTDETEENSQNTHRKRKNKREHDNAPLPPVSAKKRRKTSSPR